MRHALAWRRSYFIVLNPQLFLSGYGFRPHASGELGSESGFFLISSPGWKKSKSESDNVWSVNPDTFESIDIAKSSPVSYRKINQYGCTTCRPSFSRVNPDTIGCVLTSESDLNTLRVHGEIFLNPARKMLGSEKYPDSCWRSLRPAHVNQKSYWTHAGRTHVEMDAIRSHVPKYSTFH